MIKEILKNQIVSTTHSIIPEKEIYLRFNSDLPQYFRKIDQLSKSGVVKLIKSNKYDNKTKLLAILFWGIYFQIMLGTNANHIVSLIKFLNLDDFEAQMGSRIKSIINSENPDELFLMFSYRGVHKIPGLSEAYFTKLFFFYREALIPEKQTYPILDKWLSIAWCAIEYEENNNPITFETYYRDLDQTDGKLYLEGIIRRQRRSVYGSYIAFLNNVAANHDTSVINLEEKFFGENLKKAKPNQFNARLLYKNWAEENNILLKKKTTKKEKEDKEEEILENFHHLNNQANPDQFYLHRTDSYWAIRPSPNPKKKTKIGLITHGGELALSKELMELLQKTGAEKIWHEGGGSKKGSKETHHYKFDNFNQAVNFLKNYINLQQC